MYCVNEIWQVHVMSVSCFDLYCFCVYTKKYTIKDYQAKCKAETLRECETPWQIVDVYSLKELLISVDNYVQFRFGGNYWETIKRVIWRKSIGNQLNIRNRKNDGC